MKFLATAEQAGRAVGYKSFIQDEYAGIDSETADIVRHHGLPTGAPCSSIKEEQGIHPRSITDRE